MAAMKSAVGTYSSNSDSSEARKLKEVWNTAALKFTAKDISFHPVRYVSSSSMYLLVRKTVVIASRQIICIGGSPGQVRLLHWARSSV